MVRHLLVLQHGIQGAPEDLRNIAEAFVAADPSQFHVVNTDVNTENTNDGLLMGGHRLADLIKREAATMDGSCSLSIVAHSLGAIYCRSALRQLEEEGWFEQHNVSAEQFISIAAPHLGILEVGPFWRWGVWFLGGALGQTIVDLALGSDVMQQLVDDVAMRALGRFTRRVLYANLDDDMWVRICSALILPAAPSVGDLAPGEPCHLSQEACDGVSTGDAEDFAFPDEQREVVLNMIRQLMSISWERYVVHFPSMTFTGHAHEKICHHWKDTGHEGAKVQAHILSLFAIETGEGT